MKKTITIPTVLLILLMSACSKRHGQIKTYVGEYEVHVRTGGYGLPNGTWVPLEVVYTTGSISKKSYRKLDFYCVHTDKHYIISLDKQGRFTHLEGDYEGIFNEWRDQPDTLVIIGTHYHYQTSIGPDLLFIKN